MIPAILFYLIIVIYFASLWKIFEKGGHPKWAGFIPVYNLYVWIKLLQKPWWWILLFIVPGINFLMLIILNLETAKQYGLRSYTDGLLAVFVPHYIIPKIAYDSSITYEGPIDWKGKKKPIWQEWGEALVFAVIAATIIRTFFIEAFTIPTGSMEKSLLVGDFLFVSKMSYGAKIPNTPLSFPFAHNTIGESKSYLEWQKLPYFRLPGLGSVERYDPLVFNFPEGDTVAIKHRNRSYYQLVREAGREMVHNNPREFGEIIVHPLDKKDNYIKRCVGMPGDNFEIIDGDIFVDGEPIQDFEGVQNIYNVTIKGGHFSRRSLEMLKEKIDLNASTIRESNKLSNTYELPLTEEGYEFMQTLPYVENIERKIDKKTNKPASRLSIFPNHKDYYWTNDNFGPLYIPKAGETIEINIDNLPLYRRVIDVYEKNELSVKGDKIYINGQETDEYTFKMDYYFLIGDNRGQSLDSRYWGFVPEDHVVGKALFVWFSLDEGDSFFLNRIRWSRIFSGVE